MTKFEQACLLAFEDWADDIPDDLPEPEYSEKHKRWVKKLFNKMRGDRYHRFTTNTVKVMLVAAVLSALLLTAFVIRHHENSLLINLIFTAHINLPKITVTP